MTDEQYIQFINSGSDDEEGSNGEQMAPREEGNTRSSSTRKRPAARVAYSITIWNGSNGSNGSIEEGGGVIPPDTLQQWIREHCTEAIWQLERADNTNRTHWQISLKLKKKQRFTWFKHFFHRHAHIEEARHIDALNRYCEKPETRLLGPFYWPERVDEVRDRFLTCIPYYWQQEILDLVRQEPDDRKVYWYWEPTGQTGKSTFTNHLVKAYGAFYATGCKKDVFHAYNSQKIVILDLPRSHESYVSYDCIEQLKNGLIFSGKYDSRMKIFNPPHLIIFANFTPDERALSADRWVIHKIDKTRCINRPNDTP